MAKKSTMHLSVKAVCFAEIDDSVQGNSFVFHYKHRLTCIKVKRRADLWSLIYLICLKVKANLF